MTRYEEILSKNGFEEILNKNDKTYAIYQLNEKDPVAKQILFMPYRLIEEQNIKIERKLYKCVFAKKMSEDEIRRSEKSDFLDWLYFAYNDHVNDGGLEYGYENRSVSVSDILVVKTDNQTNYYFVDNIGFKKIDF